MEWYTVGGVLDPKKEGGLFLVEVRALSLQDALLRVDQVLETHIVEARIILAREGRLE